MERAASGAGVTLRPNNSLAGVPGSLGCASGGSGAGFTEPRSWVRAPVVAKASAAAATMIDRITGFSTSLIRAPAEHFPAKWLPVYRRKCDQIGTTQLA